MTRKVAVAILYGMGDDNHPGPKRMTAGLAKRCNEFAGDIVFHTIDWGVGLQEQQDELWLRLGKGGPMFRLTAFGESPPQ